MGWILYFNDCWNQEEYNWRSFWEAWKRLLYNGSIVKDSFYCNYYEHFPKIFQVWKVYTVVWNTKHSFWRNSRRLEKTFEENDFSKVIRLQWCTQEICRKSLNNSLEIYWYISIKSWCGILEQNNKPLKRKTWIRINFVF